MQQQQKLITFLHTPIMTTYLLAFCIGEFDSAQSISNSTRHLINQFMVILH